MVDWQTNTVQTQKKGGLLYNADITFAQIIEFGFDYLHVIYISSSPRDLVQRKHNYSVVDEDWY